MDVLCVSWFCEQEVAILNKLEKIFIASGFHSLGKEACLES